MCRRYTFRPLREHWPRWGHRAGRGPAPTLAACPIPPRPKCYTGPNGPSGWHKACPYIIGPTWRHCRANVTTLSGHHGDIVGPSWRHCRPNVATLSGQHGDICGPTWRHFRAITVAFADQRGGICGQPSPYPCPSPATLSPLPSTPPLTPPGFLPYESRPRNARKPPAYPTRAAFVLTSPYPSLSGHGGRIL